MLGVGATVAEPYGRYGMIQIKPTLSSHFHCTVLWELASYSMGEKTEIEVGLTS